MNMQTSSFTQPMIILVRPQIPENIGASARAMLNFGMSSLRVVAPRNGWSEGEIAKARPMAAGADKVLEEAGCFATLKDAVADIHYLLATTARLRDMDKPSFQPEEAVLKLAQISKGERAAIIFGPENAGLTNQEISLADGLIHIPANPQFSSLNLAQSVLLISYLCWGAEGQKAKTLSKRAERAKLLELFSHLEAALDEAGFLKPAEKRPAMVVNLRNMLMRAELSEQDIHTLRGVINALLRWPREEKNEKILAKIAKISSMSK